MSKEFSYAGALSVSFNKLAAHAVITIALLSAVLCTDSDNSTESLPSLLEVQIYYETLCPDSKRFIRYPFYDAMIEKKLFNYTDIKFIPYGKVMTWTDPQTGKDYLICQHGSRECELNALHACIVENNSKMEQLQMIDCLIGGFTVENCSENLKINVDAALNCKSSRSVEEILKKYGKETDAIDLWFVPSISLDGTFDSEVQNSLLKDFANVFCDKYKQKFNVTLDSCS